MGLTLISGLSGGHGLWSGTAGLSGGNGLGGSSGIDPAAAAYFAAVTAAGGTVSPAGQVLYNNLFVSLRSAGLLVLLDRLWLLAAENSTAALIDLVARSTATAVNSPTFTANQGYAGNGTSSYIDTNAAPNALTQYIQNSASFGVYTRTNRSTAAAKAAMGAINTSTGLWVRYSDTKIYFDVNSLTSPGALGPAGTAGMWAVTRTGVSTVAVYQNGASFASSTPTSTAVPITTFLIDAIPISGSPSNFNDDQQAAAFIGGALNATQAASLSSVINSYMTSIGANVY